VANADASYWQLGAAYALSKRTNFYTSYSIIRNDALGSTGSGTAGVDISWLNVGIRHKF
jgi:predicted porin